MEEIKSLESMGITMPTPAYLFGVVLFSIVGYAAYRYGKKASVPSTKWIGVALMLYPYVVSDTLMMYMVGIALSIGLFVTR